MISKKKTFPISEKMTSITSSQETKAKTYATECLEKMNYFRKAGMFCDVVFESRRDERVKFRVHKLVLASASSYFQAMFTSEMLESAKDTIKLDIDSDSLEVIFDFVYTNMINLESLEKAQDVLFAANMLLLRGVESACTDFIAKNLNKTNCFSIAEVAEMIRNQELRKSVITFMQDNFDDIARMEEFMTLPQSFIECILSSNKLNVRCESQVLMTAIKWINHQPSISANDVADVFEHVRFPLVPHQILLDVEINEQTLFTNTGCNNYLEEAKKYHLQPEKRSLLSNARTRPRQSYPKKLYVVGGLAGFDSPDAYLNEVHCTEVVSDMDKGNLHWNQKKSMEVARESAAVVSLNGVIYVMGGVCFDANVSLVERYNPVTDSWKKMASLNQCKGQLAGCVMDGWLYAIGGSDDGRREGIKSVEKYHPLEDEWKPVTPMHTRRGALGVEVLEDKIYACGGASFNYAFRSVEMYDSTKGKWFVRAQMNRSRSFHDVVSLRGYLYALGGAEMRNGELTSIQDTVERYCPKANEWTLVRSLQIPCWGLRAAVNTQKPDRSSDEVYIVGKFHTDSGYDTVAKLTVQDDNFFSK